MKPAEGGPAGQSEISSSYPVASFFYFLGPYSCCPYIFMLTTSSNPKTRLYLLFIFTLMFVSMNFQLVKAMSPRIAPKLTNAGRQTLRSRGDLSMMKTSCRKYVRVVTDIDDTVKVSDHSLLLIFLLYRKSRYISFPFLSVAFRSVPFFHLINFSETCRLIFG